MSNLLLDNSIKYADSPNIDAFSRLRTSIPTGLFYAFNEYKISTLEWDLYTVGDGSITHSTTTKNVTLSTGGTTSGNRAVLQSKRYIRYVPGNSFIPIFTFVSGSPVTNAAQRIGMFDDNNGFFVEQLGTTLSLVRRSNTSGAVVDTKISQNNWNIDRLDGSNGLYNPSGITLDFTKGQIFGYDMQFLGVGRVRMFFDIGGQIVPVHEWNHANLTATLPYIGTPNLPVRYEVVNVGTASGTTTLNVICAAIHSEGGANEYSSRQFNATNGVTLKTISNSSMTPILAIRPGPLFNGITNRAHMVVQSVSAFVINQNMHYKVIWNPVLTNANWQVVNTTYAMAQYDISATSYTGGLVIDSGYVAGGGSVKSMSEQTNSMECNPLVNSFDGTTPDLLLIAGQALSGTNCQAGATMTWEGKW
jgi:hypothetical protein